MKNEAIASCRVSSREQRIEGHSLETQEENVLKAAEQLGVKIIKTWSVDVSSKAGRNAQRKDIQEMLGFVKQHRGVKYLIVDRVNRFMRSHKEFFYFEYLFNQQGVKLWYASQPDLNTDDHWTRFRVLMEIFSAESENINRKMQCVGGLIKQVEKGYLPLGMHAGYMRGSIKNLHVPDPERFELLKTARLDILYRGMGTTEALNKLNDSGYRTKSGKKLKIQSFMNQLRDEYYAGVVDMKGSVIQIRNENGLHRSMYTLEEHGKLQAILDGKNKKFHRQQYNPEFPLNKIMLCSECGGKFTGSFQTNGRGTQKYDKYRCRGCGKQYYRKVAHDALNGLLKQIQPDESKKSNFILALKAAWKQKQNSTFAQIANMKKHLASLENTKSQLIKTLAISNKGLQYDIQQEIEKVKEEIEGIENKINTLSNIEKDLDEFVSYALNFVSHLVDQWWKLEPADRLKCQQLLFPSGIVFNGQEKVSTAEISPLYRLAAIKKEPEIVSDSLLVEVGKIAFPSERLKV